MAFASIGTGGTAQGKTSVTTWSPTVSPGWQSGELVVIVVAANNIGTTDGDLGDIASVTATNVSGLTKARQYTNGQGGSANGATVGVYHGIASGAGTSVTVTFASATGAYALSVWRFSKSAGTTIELDTNGLGFAAGDNVDPPSIGYLPGALREYLFVRGIAGETSSTTALTPTSGWTALDGIETSGGGSAANMAVRGEWHIVTTDANTTSDPTWVASDNSNVLVLLYEQSSGTTVTGSFTADAYIKSVIAGSFTANAHIKSVDITQSVTADALVRRSDIAGSFTADAFVANSISGTFTADSNVAATVAGGLTADAYIRRLDLPGSFTADAYVKRVDQPGSLTADAYLATTTSASFTADSHIRATVGAALTADSHIRATITSSVVADAYLRRTDLTGGLTGDAYISATQSASLVADAYILRTASASLTADAHLRATVASSLTADAYVKATLTGSFTADAYLRTTTSASLTADAYIKATQSASVTADAHIGRVARVYWTTPTDGEIISATPELRFRIPSAIGPVHFYLQLDTVNAFNSGSLREYRSSRDQTGWEYWNGTTWVAVPASGVPTTYVGNEARFTVPTALAAGTWYRRIAAGA